MSIHREPHPLAGQTVKLALTGPDVGGLVNGATYVVEDWWDRVFGDSWQCAAGNPAALKYAVRSGLAWLPTDDEVVYGKSEGLGHLVHVSELAEPTTATVREWAVLWPAVDDADEGVELHDEAEARRVASMYPHQGAECAYREVTRGPWTVVPNGDPR